MKKKVHKKVVRQLDGTTFMLLAFVAIALLAFFGWQTETLPGFLLK